MSKLKHSAVYDISSAVRAPPRQNRRRSALDAGDGQAKIRRMNTDENQFSVNRAASKKQILITSLFAVTHALLSGADKAEAASSAFAYTQAGTSEHFNGDFHSASGTFSANSPDSHYAVEGGSALTNFARASVVGHDIRLLASAWFSGDPVIASVATASGEWQDTVFLSLDSTLYPDVTVLNPHAIIQISATITGTGAARLDARTTLLCCADFDISGGTQTIDVPGTASDFTTQGVSRVFAIPIDFIARVTATAGFFGGGIHQRELCLWRYLWRFQPEQR